MKFDDIEIEIMNILENDIYNSLTDEEFHELGLDSKDVWFNMDEAELPLVDEKGQDSVDHNVDGIKLTFEENEYYEDGDVVAEPWHTGVFVPLSDFKKARLDVWNKKYRGQENETTRVLKAVVETIQKRLGYNNIEELIDKVKNQGYEGKEIPYTRDEGYQKSKDPSGDLSYRIGENKAFNEAIKKMVEQSPDTIGDINKITGQIAQEKNSDKGEKNRE